MAEVPSPPDPSSTVRSLSAPPLPLPAPFFYTHPTPSVITQGAEAILFRTTFLTPDRPCALKYRPTKPWRHPTLDARLTRHRILTEARTLVKCRREGASVPAVLSLDWEGSSVGGSKEQKSGGWMMMEWIEGDTVRNALNRWLKSARAINVNNFDLCEAQKIPLAPEFSDLMRRIGLAIGKMHEIGIVHGDLTTSNLMLRTTGFTEGITNGNMEACDDARSVLDGEVVLIDFGLAAQSLQDEDKAVDLYVLERAFGSTHPTVEKLFGQVLDAYHTSYKSAHVVLKRLEDVRMRGRKRSMLG